MKQKITDFLKGERKLMVPILFSMMLATTFILTMTIY